jgi:hypothetical protein
MKDEDLEPASETLAQLGITADEIETAEQSIDKRNRDSRICACGHRMSAHTVVAGASFCRPTKLECPCKSPRPVLTVSDTRSFNYKTEGSGALHALSRGILALARRGGRSHWLIELKCDRCSRQVDRLLPSAVSQRGRAMTEPTGYDALLCEECRSEI